MKHNALFSSALLIASFATYSSLHASALDPKFDYQLYLDFALNKGQFAPNTQNIFIPAKDSSHSFSFDAPMIDFSATNSFSNARVQDSWKAEFTNIGLGYVITAAHMFAKTPQDKHLASNGSALEFGGATSVIVDSAHYWSGAASAVGDFAVVKMSKFNLNQSAQISPDLNFVSTHNPQGQSMHDKYTFNADEVRELGDSKRYTFFAREGTGVQMIGYEGQGATKIEDNDMYHTGGLAGFSKDLAGRNAFSIPIENYDWTNNFLRIPFTSSSAPGDSGSALYVYDSLHKKWYVIGVVSTSDCRGESGDLCSIANYAVINTELINEFRESKSLTLGGGAYRFNTNGQLVDSMGQDMGASVISDSVAGNLYWESLFNKTKFEQRIGAMQNSKDIILSGTGTLSLEKNTDLGAGGLVFGKDSVWSIDDSSTNAWFVHGGIFADSGSLITYNVKTLDNDFLHKIGSGTLRITTSSPNAGLRIGEGSVELSGNALSFKEVYLTSGRGSLKITDSANINTDFVYFGVRGGSLDMNGQNLTFGRIFASDNGTNLINSHANPSTLTLTQTCGGANTTFSCSGTQDYLYHGNIISHAGGINIESGVSGKSLIFDGNIDNAQGVMNFKDGSLTFQGHPTIHAYVDSTTKAKLDTLNIGQNVFTSPTSFSQSDWEHRIFSLKELNITNANFNLAHNATLQTTLNAQNSTLYLGSEEVWLDANDGDNVSTRLQGGNNSSGNPTYTAGNDMRFEQSIKRGKASNAANSNNVFFVGNLNLSSSTATLGKMNMQGNIESHSGTNRLTITDSTLQGSIGNAINATTNITLNNATIIGDITDVTQLNANTSFMQGAIITHSLFAQNSIFKLDVDFSTKQAQSITSSLSTQGGNNTLMLNLLNAPNTSVALPSSILLASLADPSQSIGTDFFVIPNINEGFSIYTPNVSFSHKDNKAQWNLEKIDVTQSNGNSYFTISPNTESINRANGLFNQVLLGYVIEWNNLQKRMGELRDNPKAVGVWIRTFGGGNSDSNYRGNFFEMQLGSDYQFDFEKGRIYVGGLFNYTRNMIQGSGVNSQSDGYGIGGYASILFDMGLYVDSVVRYIYRNHQVNASFIPNGVGSVSALSSDSGANNVLFSLEVGHRVRFGEFFNHRAVRHLYLEGQVELIAGYLQGMQWQNQNVRLEMRDSAPVSIKIGVFAGNRFFLGKRNDTDNIAKIVATNTSTNEESPFDSLIAKHPDSHTSSHTPTPQSHKSHSLNQTLGVRVGLGYAGDITQYGTRILYDSSGARSYEGIRDNRMFVSLAGDYVINDRTRVALEFERSFFGILNLDWLVNASVRVGF